MKIEDLPYAVFLSTGINDVLNGRVISVCGHASDRKFFLSKNVIDGFKPMSISDEVTTSLCSFNPSSKSFIELQEGTEFEFHLAACSNSGLAGLYLCDNAKSRVYLAAVFSGAMMPDDYRVCSDGYERIPDDRRFSRCARVMGDKRWTVFNYSNFKAGVFWVNSVGQECDDEGELVPSGKTVSKVVLVKIGIQTDGQPFFDSIDPTSFGYVEFEDLVTHYRPVTPPEAPN